VKHKRLVIVSLTCILLTSAVLAALSASRLLRAGDYASQFAATARVNESGTNLSLVVYGGDPQPFRQSLELFQLVKAQNIEWSGTSTDGQGNPVNIAFKLGSVNFAKLNANTFNGTATALNSHVSIDDLIDVTVRADTVNVNITFWTYMGSFPAINVTGVLTGSVYVKMSVQVLPIHGLDFAFYESSGDKFTVNICSIKPVNMILQAPTNNQKVGGDVMVQALIQAVPELSLENVWFGTDYGENMPMRFNEGNGLWECVWQTYHVGNGGHNIKVHAEAVDREGGQEIARYASDAGVWVEVNNPWVNSYMDKGQGLEGFGGLEVRLTQDSNSWSQGTGFPIWLGLKLEAPQSWADGQMQFNCWRIDDQGTIFQDGNPTLTITQEVFGMLFDGAGNARELKCIYLPNPA
jgi:hypothetical protein